MQAIYERLKQLYRLQPSLIGIMNRKESLTELLEKARKLPSNYKSVQKETDEFSPFRNPQRVIKVTISKLEKAIARFKK